MVYSNSLPVTLEFISVTVPGWTDFLVVSVVSLQFSVFTPLIQNILDVYFKSLKCPKNAIIARMFIVFLLNSNIT